MVITYNFNNEEYDYEYEFDINDFIEYIWSDICEYVGKSEAKQEACRETIQLLYNCEYISIDSIEEEDKFKDFVEEKYSDKAEEEYWTDKGNEEMRKDIARGKNMKYKVGDLVKIKNRVTGSLKELNNEVAQIVAVDYNAPESYLIDLDKMENNWYDNMDFDEYYIPTIEEHIASCRKLGVCFDYDDDGKKIVEDKKCESIEPSKEWYEDKIKELNEVIFKQETFIELLLKERKTKWKK